MMTPEELAEIKALNAARTPGKWIVGYLISKCILDHFPHGQGQCDYRVVEHVKTGSARHQIFVDVPIGTPHAEVEIIAGSYDVDCGGVVNPQDAEFIARMSTAVPAMIAEIERLNTVVADYQDGRRRILSEQCAPDEKHCACVPELRAEIEQLRKEN